MSWLRRRGACPPMSTRDRVRAIFWVLVYQIIEFFFPSIEVNASTYRRRPATWMELKTRIKQML